MGQSTDGQLWYGVVFEDGYEFPWTAEPFDGDAEEWWLRASGFTPTREIYDGHNYAGGKKPDQSAIDRYYEERRIFKVAHPCPVEVINYCSGEYPMYGLAVRGTVTTANRGYPKLIEGLGISDGETRPLQDFLAKYELKPEGEMGWYLTSYWG